MFDLDRMKDALPQWAQEYFDQVDRVRQKVPPGWHLYGEKKDDSTPRFMIWRGTNDQYEARELVIA